MRAYFSQGLFGRDLLGSVVVFLVALPLCMGIAIASGMPPSAGLISGIVGGLIVGAIAGSPLQVSGRQRVLRSWCSNWCASTAWPPSVPSCCWPA